MLDLTPDVILELPLDDLALCILRDMDAEREWNEWNYLNAAGHAGYRGDALNAIAEACAWLRGRALIARDPKQSTSEAIIITRRGRSLLAEGLRPMIIT